MHINMKKEKKYIEYILKQAEALLAIDSPSGFTEKVTDYLCEEYKRLGYKPVKTKKGGVLVEIGGKGNAVLTMAHVDTLGGMVAEIKINGRLRLTKVGGLNANNIETENCRIYTLDGKVRRHRTADGCFHPCQRRLPEVRAYLRFRGSPAG